MRTYIIRRLLLIIPTLFIVSIMVFLSVRFIPGSVIELMAGNMAAQAELSQEEIIEIIRHQMGLDAPVHVQYIRWVGGVFHGDLGTSLWTNRPIFDEIVQRIPISLELGIMAIITGLLIAFPIGIYSAIRQDTIGDYVGRSFAIMCIAVPGFWIGTLVFVYPAIWWNWSPPVEYIPFTANPGANLMQFLIPGVIMGMVMSGVTMRMTRTMMLEVLRQDYIRTAWSKGLRESVVVIRHALKNALIPVVTIVGLQLPIIIGGAVIMEQIFVLPGIGRLMVDALGQRDYPIISGINIMMATVILLANLLVDLTYAWLDPRIRYR
ncbi:MAG TPA: ABC transporter permease [Dehalococcoidales bacterium]